MQFLAQMQGKIGLDVWDKEVFIDAADFMDAAQQAAAGAAELDGQVTNLTQCDFSEEDALERAVSRFLAWKLPKDFHPDGGMVFIPTKGRGPDSPHWPVGTNLLTAKQARKMIRHVLGISPTSLTFKTGVSLQRARMMASSSSRPSTACGPLPA